MQPVAGSKSTKREHLEQVAKTLGRRPKELADKPSLPTGMAHLWEWFFEARAGMPDGWSWQGLQAWAQMTGAPITAADAMLLLRIEKVLIEVRDGRRCNQSSS